MKTWLIRVGVGVLAIALVLAIVTGVWAMIASASGAPLTPALELAGTGVRILLGLGVAAIPGVLFWLAVLIIALVARRVGRGAELNTAQDGTRLTPGQFPAQ